MDRIEQRIRDAVKELFHKDRVDLVIGFREGSLPLKSRPLFVRSKDMADDLVWNAFCRGNLAVYLPKLFPPQPRRDEDKKPYPGLASFTQQDAEFFFGREAEVEAVWKKLQRTHLLALIGPLGAGKSSFLQAGLVPAMSERWCQITCHPGTRP